LPCWQETAAGLFVKQKVTKHRKKFSIRATALPALNFQTKRQKTVFFRMDFQLEIGYNKA
jgi:hypothetical protein